MGDWRHVPREAIEAKAQRSDPAAHLAARLASGFTSDLAAHSLRCSDHWYIGSGGDGNQGPTGWRGSAPISTCSVASNRGHTHTGRNQSFQGVALGPFAFPKGQIFYITRKLPHPDQAQHAHVTMNSISLGRCIRATYRLPALQVA